MAGLSLSAEINDVLLQRRAAAKEYQVILLLAEKYEQGNWQAVAKLSKLLKIHQEKLPEIFEKSLEAVIMFEIGN